MFEQPASLFAVKMIGSFLVLSLLFNAAVLTWR
jgi:hypothetical protein